MTPPLNPQQFKTLYRGEPAIEGEHRVGTWYADSPSYAAIFTHGPKDDPAKGARILSVDVPQETEPTHKVPGVFFNKSTGIYHLPEEQVKQAKPYKEF